MINKEDIIKELIEMGVEVDSKIIEKKLKEIYVNEGFALTKEISFMQNIISDFY